MHLSEEETILGVMRSEFDLERFYKTHHDDGTSSPCRRVDVVKLLEWALLQEHLPPITEFHAMVFLHSCYGDMKAAQTTIENYFTSRTNAPEIFTNSNPFSDEMMAIKRNLIVAPLPKSLPNGNALIYYKLKNTDPQAFNSALSMRYVDMTCTLLRKLNGPQNGLVMLVDCDGFSLMHILKINLILLRKYFFFLQEGMPVRMKGMVLFNASTVMDRLVAMVRPLIRHDIVETAFRPGDDRLYDLIPKEYLPDSIGGSVGSLEKIYEQHVAYIDANADYLRKEELMVVDESKRVQNRRFTFFGIGSFFK